MASWIQSNFLFAIGIALVMIILGLFIGVKAESRFGYVISVLGFVLVVWAMKLK